MPTLRSLEALESEGLLSPDPRLQDAAQSMAIAITPEMVALIDRSRLADDPIARQFVPRPKSRPANSPTRSATRRGRQ